MGAGIALQIKQAYPEVAKANREYYEKNAGNSFDMLGTNLYIKTHDGRTCANLYAQDHYRNDKSRKTDYIAFKSCLARLAKKLSMSDRAIKVGFPYGIGCGLGGGDWFVIKQMIQDFSEHIAQDVYIVRREN